MVAKTRSDTRAGKGHAAAVAGPAVGVTVPRRVQVHKYTRIHRKLSIFRLKAEVFVTHIMVKFQKAQAGLLLREYFI